MDLDLSEGPTATGAATELGGDATGLTEQPRPKPITFNPYVDKVVDQVAEKVKSSFMAFIKTFVFIYYICTNTGSLVLSWIQKISTT